MGRETECVYLKSHITLILANLWQIIPASITIAQDCIPLQQNTNEILYVYIQFKEKY